MQGYNISNLFNFKRTAISPRCTRPT